MFYLTLFSSFPSSHRVCNLCSVEEFFSLSYSSERLSWCLNVNDLSWEIFFPFPSYPFSSWNALESHLINFTLFCVALQSPSYPSFFMTSDIRTPRFLVFPRNRHRIPNMSAPHLATSLKAIIQLPDMVSGLFLQSYAMLHVLELD